MSGVSLPVTRPVGRALVIASAATRPAVVGVLERIGFSCAQSDDPYAGMLDVCRKPLEYQAVVLSLAGLYREELSIIASLKRRFPRLEVWLAHTDGKPAVMAEAMRFGADGLLSDDGLHRIALTGVTETVPAPRIIPPILSTPITPVPANGSPAAPAVSANAHEAVPSGSGLAEALAAQTQDEFHLGEPVLSADELRALLQEQPSLPPSGGGE